MHLNCQYPGCLEGAIVQIPVTDPATDKSRYENRCKEHNKFSSVYEITFMELRRINAARCEAVFNALDSWSETDWATALAGETGELCNLIKKRRRGESINTELLADEIADIAIYLDLLAAKLGIRLDSAIKKKFNQVSDERGAGFRL